MSNDLPKMSLEELWKLFPIELVLHNPEWARWYAEEASRITTLLPEGSVDKISHIGSTAIDSIWAKPIIDILLEINDDVDLSEISKFLTQNGYICMSEEKMTFNRGYTPKGYADKVFHVHLRHVGDNDEIYFRDYLNAHPDAAKEYEALKLSLWKRYEHDRDKYTEEKSAFVKKIVTTAKKK